jgi:hypothetical protein
LDRELRTGESYRRPYWHTVVLMTMALRVARTASGPPPVPA